MNDTDMVFFDNVFDQFNDISSKPIDNEMLRHIDITFEQQNTDYDLPYLYREIPKFFDLFFWPLEYNIKISQ